MDKNILHVGLDVGSTTVKIIVMNDNREIIYKDYQRHYSDTKNTVCSVLDDLNKKYPGSDFTLSLTYTSSKPSSPFANYPIGNFIIVFYNLHVKLIY